jgi:hypothetical protein
MNYNFQFPGTDYPTNANLQSRQKVDDEIRIATGDKPDADHWSPVFEALVFCVGIKCAMGSNKSSWNEAEVRAAVEAVAVDREETAKRFDGNNDEMAADYREYAANYRDNVKVFVEFMCKRYTFNLWRS